MLGTDRETFLEEAHGSGGTVIVCPMDGWKLSPEVVRPPGECSTTRTWPRSRSPKRTWTTYSYLALWVGMAINIPTWLLASGLMASGFAVLGAVHDLPCQRDRPDPDAGHQPRRGPRTASLPRAGAGRSASSVPTCRRSFVPR